MGNPPKVLSDRKLFQAGTSGLHQFLKSQEEARPFHAITGKTNVHLHNLR